MNTAVSDFTLKHEKYSTRRSNSGTRLANFLGFSLVAVLQRYPGKLSVEFVVHQREMAVGNTMWVWIQASLDGADGQEIARNESDHWYKGGEQLCTTIHTALPWYL